MYNSISIYILIKIKLKVKFEKLKIKFKKLKIKFKKKLYLRNFNENKIKLCQKEDE